MFEKQVNKRLRSILLHSATQHNISPATVRLLFKSSQNGPSAHVYDGGRHIKVLPLSSILEFFGQDYNDRHAAAIESYLCKLAKEEDMEIYTLHLVLCEANSEVGVYLYDGSKYKKKLSSITLITHFIQHHDE